MAEDYKSVWVMISVGLCPGPDVGQVVTTHRW